MSRKITSFLMLLMAFFFSSNAMAQDEIDLTGKAVSVGGIVADFEPNTWYFMHQGRDAGTGVGQYAPVPVGEIPSYGGFLYDQGIGKDILKPGVGNLSEEVAATSAAGFLVRFIPTENEGAYNIQFGTGNFMTGPAGTGNGQKFSSTDSPYDAGEFNLYAIDAENAPGAFGINVYDMGQRIDNNFASASGIATGNTVVAWGSGKHETVLDDNSMIVSNSIWGIAEVIWSEKDPREAAAEEMNNTYGQYFPYLETFAANVGTLPGQYSEETVSAFDTALQNAYDAYDAVFGPDGSDLTIEELKALQQAIIDAYEAVLASKVPITLADGYYRIKAGMKYHVDSVDEESGEPVTTYYDKYMMSIKRGENINATWGTPDDLSTDCPSLWKITNKEGGVFDIVSVATNARFNNVAKSTAVTMSTESENLMAIDIAGAFNDTLYFNIRVSTQATGDFLYLHQNNHGSGAGTGSNIVGWSNTFSQTEGPKASEWMFETVSDEDVANILAAWEIINNHDQMVYNYQEMVADAKAKIEIAKDVQTKLDQETPLITDVSQLSSPYTETSEGSIDALIDGDVNTFWHSSWSGGAVPGGTHYLQVEMMDESVANAAFTYTRRAVANDHMTECGIYGTNDPQAEKADCELLGTASLPFTNNTETLTSNVFPTKGYRYLRFYANNTTGNGSTTRGYFHMAEFQLYPAEVLQSETCQYNVMGDLAKNLEAVIEAQKDIESADLTIDEYEAMKAVYDAFIAKFVDPAELRQTLENVAPTATVIAVGNQPGYWPEGSNADALLATIATAEAYDKAGDYTPERSTELVETLNNQSKDVYASANGIKEGKWYAIRFGSKEFFEEHEWDLVAGNGNYNEEKGIWTAPDLWNKYVAVTEQITEEDGNVEMEESEADQVAVGHQMHFIYDEGISEFANKDLALFRFINVGDSAYILQNKATNLFLKSAATGAVTLSAHPSLYNQRAIGYGLNVIAAKSLTGESQNYLHAQVGGNLLVNWNVDTPGSRSGLFIEEIEDVASDYEGNTFNVALKPGEVHIFCFPVEVSAGDNTTLWGVSSVEGTKVTLAKIEGAANGGRPFIAVANGEYDAENEQEMYHMNLTYNITAPKAETAAPLKGSYAGEKVGSGVIIAEGNTLAVAKKSNTTVEANSGWIAGDKAFALDATIEVVFDTEAPDGIQTALQQLSRAGEAYTLDGRRVSRKATLNDLQRYGKGIYILNGVKVVVK